MIGIPHLGSADATHDIAYAHADNPDCGYHQACISVSYILLHGLSYIAWSNGILTCTHCNQPYTRYGGW